MPDIQLLVLLGIGTLVSSIVEAILGKEAVSRFFAHVVGATLVLIIAPVFMGTPLRHLLTVEFLTQHMRSLINAKTQVLVFVGVSALAPLVPEAILGPKPRLGLVTHLLGLLLGSYVADWPPLDLH